MNQFNDRKYSFRQVVFLLTIAFLGLALVSFAASVTVTVPNTFKSGDTISSSQVNANFSALASAMPAIKTAETNTWITLVYSAPVGTTVLTRTDILSITVTPPADGYVNLVGTGTLFQNPSAANNLFKFEISDDPQVAIGVDGNFVNIGFATMLGATYFFSFSVNAVFPVAANTPRTFYLYGLNFYGNGPAWANSNRLTAVFYPRALP